jgi:hypothetical protein
VDPSTALRSCVLEKILEQIDRTEHLIGLLPPNSAEWTPEIPGSWPVGALLGHLLDAMAGFCAALYAASPNRLPQLRELRNVQVNHLCSASEALGRIALYRTAIEGGFSAITDADLGVAVPTVFVSQGEPLLTLLLGNLEHLLNHKYQLFMYLKLMGIDARTADLYCFRG